MERSLDFGYASTRDDEMKTPFCASIGGFACLIVPRSGQGRRKRRLFAGSGGGGLLTSSGSFVEIFDFSPVVVTADNLDNSLFAMILTHVSHVSNFLPCTTFCARPPPGFSGNRQIQHHISVGDSGGATISDFRRFALGGSRSRSRREF